MTPAGYRRRGSLIAILATLAVLAVVPPALAADPAPSPTPIPSGDDSIAGAVVAPGQLDTLTVAPCPGAAASCAETAGLAWLRVQVPWRDLQPQAPAAGYAAEPDACPAAYCYWDRAAFDATRTRVAALAARGHTVVLVVDGTPAWANGADAPCRPPTAPATYASFLGNLVKAFAAASGPTPVRHWQVWDEPDAATPDPAAAGAGCFGTPGDAASAGAQYAALLAAAYPAVKAADPDASVVLGGLELACSDCPAHGFLRGLLAAGGGAAFDILDFHADVPWVPGRPSPQDPAFAGWTDAASGRGLVLDKLTFVRSLLTELDAGDKPIMVGQAALVCAAPTGPCPDVRADPEFQAEQAATVVRTSARALAEGLLAVVWAPLGDGGTGQGELIDLAPGAAAPKLRPGWQALRTVAGQLAGATLKRPLTCEIAAEQELCRVGGPTTKTTAYTGYRYEGYLFCRGTDAVTVAWSNDRTAPALRMPLPAGATAVDAVGVAQPGPAWVVQFTPSIVVRPGDPDCAGRSPAAAPVAPEVTSAPETTGEPPPSLAGTASTAPLVLPARPAESTGPLPFTGATVIPLVAAALILLTAGIMAVRSGRRRTAARPRR
jgi:hypothetical protein